MARLQTPMDSHHRVARMSVSASEFTPESTRQSLPIASGVLHHVSYICLGVLTFIGAHAPVHMSGAKTDRRRLRALCSMWCIGLYGNSCLGGPIGCG